jgi:hypothetical protein
MRATDMGLWDVVAVLQVSPGVKRKTRNGSRGWRGEAEHLGCGDGHRSGGQLLDSARAPKVSSRAAKAVKLLIFSTPAKLYVYETILERSAQDLEDMAPALRQFIQEEYAVVGQ